VPLAEMSPENLKMILQRYPDLKKEGCLNQRAPLGSSGQVREYSRKRRQ